MRKGKAPVMEEKVVWTAGSDGKSNYCVGVFNEDADRSFIIKEVKSAPVQHETLESRVSLAKQKREIVSDPTNPGYSEKYVLVVVSKDLDDEDIKEIGLREVPIAADDFKSINTSLSPAEAKKLDLSKAHKVYRFSVSPTKSEE